MSEYVVQCPRCLITVIFTRIYINNNHTIITKMFTAKTVDDKVNFFLVSNFDFNVFHFSSDIKPSVLASKQHKDNVTNLHAKDGV